MAYQIGDRIGDYEVVGVLGAGGMGKVYKVRNVISDRVEAMKVLLPNLEGDPELADRFMREIKVQASLQHPNIAGLHTALRLNNQLVMLIEFVEGRTIEQELRNGPIPVAKGVDYIKQVLSALSFAHARGVVHRDIKPANMMLMPDGTVKLMDFGIAKATADRKLTQTGSTVGSLYYMSPEQIQGAIDLDGRSDLYSVGVSLYEMVTNRRPFQGDSDYSIMAAHLTSTPVAPIDLDPSLPKGLNDIVLMSIAKDPAQRFQTADAFRNAIASVSISAAAADHIPTVAMQGSATRIGSAVETPATTVAQAQPSGNLRGLYMAIGSAVTVVLLVLAAWHVPKFFNSSSASTTVTDAKQQPVSSSPPVQQQPAPSTTSTTVPDVGTPAKPNNKVDAPLRNEAKQTVVIRGVLRQVPSTPVAQSHPVETAQATQPQATQPQSTPAYTPATPAVNLQEIDDLRERLLLLATRANSIKGSLDSMRRQMGGLNLNAEFTTREQRMELYLDQADAALKAGDAARAKKSLDSADRVVEELEKKLGR